MLARKDELIQALTLLDVKQQELQKQTALNELKKKTIQLTSQLAEEERAQRQQHDRISPRWVWVISSGSDIRYN